MNIESILNYNYIFQNPTAYSYKQESKKQPNLYHYYFTPIPHLLLNTTSSYTLPLESLESPREDTVPHSGNRPTGIYSSRPVQPPILTPSKTTTYEPSIVLHTQL